MVGIEYISYNLQKEILEFVCPLRMRAKLSLLMVSAFAFPGNFSAFGIMATTYSIIRTQRNRNVLVCLCMCVCVHLRRCLCIFAIFPRFSLQIFMLMICGYEHGMHINISVKSWKLNCSIFVRNIGWTDIVCGLEQARRVRQNRLDIHWIGTCAIPTLMSFVLTCYRFIQRVSCTFWLSVIECKRPHERTYDLFMCMCV